jgi:hypothetical protein
MKIAEARKWATDNGLSITKTTSMDEIVDLIIENGLQDEAMEDGFDESLFDNNDTPSSRDDEFDQLFGRSETTAKQWQRVSRDEFKKLPSSEKQKYMNDEQITNSAETVEIRSIKHVQVNGEDRWIVLTTLGKRFWLNQAPPTSGVVGVTKIPTNTWFPNWVGGQLVGVMRCKNDVHYRISKDAFVLTYADRIRIQAKAGLAAADATAE